MRHYYTSSNDYNCNQTGELHLQTQVTEKQLVKQPTPFCQSHHFQTTGKTQRRLNIITEDVEIASDDEGPFSVLQQRSATNMLRTNHG